MQILISPDGTARMIYTDDFDAQAIGQASITRASHVEPAPGGGWTADMGPSGGAILGPFATRAAALAAEVAWLEHYRL